MTGKQIRKVSREVHRITAEIDSIRENTSAKEFENVQNEIVAKFYDSAEFMRIAKEVGISPNILKMIFVKFIGTGKKGEK